MATAVTSPKRETVARRAPQARLGPLWISRHRVTLPHLLYLLALPSGDRPGGGRGAFGPGAPLETAGGGGPLQRVPCCNSSGDKPVGQRTPLSGGWEKGRGEEAFYVVPQSRGWGLLLLTGTASRAQRRKQKPLIGGRASFPSKHL